MALFTVTFTRRIKVCVEATDRAAAKAAAEGEAMGECENVADWICCHDDSGWLFYDLDDGYIGHVAYNKQPLWIFEPVKSQDGTIRLVEQKTAKKHRAEECQRELSDPELVANVAAKRRHGLPVYTEGVPCENEDEDLGMVGAAALGFPEPIVAGKRKGRP